MAIIDSQVHAYEANTPKRPSDSQRAMLMGGACARACGWSPKKG